MERPKGFDEFWDSFLLQVVGGADKNAAAKGLPLSPSLRALIKHVARMAFYAGGFAAVMITLESANTEDQSKFDALVHAVNTAGLGDLH